MGTPPPPPPAPVVGIHTGSPRNTATIPRRLSQVTFRNTRKRRSRWTQGRRQMRELAFGFRLQVRDPDLPATHERNLLAVARKRKIRCTLESLQARGLGRRSRDRPQAAVFREDDLIVGRPF